MEYVPSPYQPGTGAEPPVLAGRTRLFEHVGARMQSVAYFGRPAPSPIVLTGVRGMGKTVALAHLRRRAEESGLAVAHARFAASGSSNTQTLVQALARSAAHWDRAPTRAWESVKQHLADFSIEVNAGVVKVGTRLEAADPTRGNLTDLVTETAATHLEHERRGLAIFVDELHTGAPEDLNTLATAAQNVISDTHAPVVIVAAGTPDTAAALERAGSSFSERFEYFNVGPLTTEESLYALVQPSVDLGVGWTPEAAEAALDAAGGNPWRIQQLGDACWTSARELGTPVARGTTIDAPLVEKASAQVVESLKHGSFAARWSNATPAERTYLTAMAQSMDRGVAETRHVNALMNRASTQNSDLRATLINKGLVTSQGRGEVAFSAPGFERFVLERQGVDQIGKRALEARAMSMLTRPNSDRARQAPTTPQRPRLGPGRGSGPEIER